MVDPIQIAWAGLAFLALLFIGGYARTVKENRERGPAGQVERAAGATRSVIITLKNVLIFTLAYLRRVGKEVYIGLGLFGGGLLWFFLPLAQIDPVAWFYVIVATASSLRAADVVQNPLVIMAFFGALFLMAYIAKRVVVALATGGGS